MIMPFLAEADSLAASLRLIIKNKERWGWLDNIDMTEANFWPKVCG